MEYEDYNQRRNRIDSGLRQIGDGLFALNVRLALIEDRIDMIELSSRQLLTDVVSRLLDSTEPRVADPAAGV